MVAGARDGIGRMIADCPHSVGEDGVSQAVKGEGEVRERGRRSGKVGLRGCREGEASFVEDGVKS